MAASEPFSFWHIRMIIVFFVSFLVYLQRQPSRGVPIKSCSGKVQSIWMRTLMPKCNFNKVAKQLYWNHTSKWVFSCNFCCIFSEHLFLRTPLNGCFYISLVCFMYKIFAKRLVLHKFFRVAERVLFIHNPMKTWLRTEV